MLVWESYAQEFRRVAGAAKRSDAFVGRCLAYAERLHASGFPIVYSQEHAAALLGYSSEYVFRAGADEAGGFYRHYNIPKPAGGVRPIDEPLPSLMEIQRWILDNILERARASKYAKAFIRGRSIRTNARFHVGRPRVLTLDIVDFFGSIRQRRIYRVFRSFGYSRQVSGLYAGLCCLNGRLPQGAPTSPALSNLVALRIDRRLGAFARSRGLYYTRYADDMTFSGNVRPSAVIGMVRKVLAEEQLQLNESKTRLMERHQQQEVTGVVVNDSIRASREYRRRIRQEVYFVRKFGVAAHLVRLHEVRGNYLHHLLGKATHALFLDPGDAELQASVAYLRMLLQTPEDGGREAASG